MEYKYSILYSIHTQAECSSPMGKIKKKQRINHLLMGSNVSPILALSPYTFEHQSYFFTFVINEDQRCNDAQ